NKIYCISSFVNDLCEKSQTRPKKPPFGPGTGNWGPELPLDKLPVSSPHPNRGSARRRLSLVGAHRLVCRRGTEITRRVAQRGSVSTTIVGFPCLRQPRGHR